MADAAAQSAAASVSASASLSPAASAERRVATSPLAVIAPLLASRSVVSSPLGRARVETEEEIRQRRLNEISRELMLRVQRDAAWGERKAQAPRTEEVSPLQPSDDSALIVRLRQTKDELAEKVCRSCVHARVVSDGLV
jgi:hypothetical protein